MKKIFYLMSLVAVMATFAACKDKDEVQAEEQQAEEQSQGTSVAPTQITLNDAFQQFFLAEDQKIQIQYTIAPSNTNVSFTLEWKSSDEKVAKVDNKGVVTGISVGSAEISVSIVEYPDVRVAKASVTVLEDAKVGDYLYSDGSWGEDANPSGKDVIAVIYWVGNASLFDPILEQDYPSCTHGLAMSLKQGKAEQWMKDFEYYFYNTDDLSGDAQTLFFNMGNSPLCDNAGSLTEWGVVHSSYADKIRPYFENEDLWAGNYYPGVGGYTYTAVLEEYTRNYPNAGRYPFQFYLNAMNLVNDSPAPLTTSRWYVPSIFEAALMVNTALTSPKDFNNTNVDDDLNPLVQHNHDNVAVVNAALGKVKDADLLPTGSDYAIASATDTYMPFSSMKDGSAPDLTCGDYFELFYICQDPIGKNAEKVAQIEKIWDDWLQENAGDKYEEYKAQTDINKDGFKIQDRYAVFLTITGYDSAYSKDIDGINLTLSLEIYIVAPNYANVGVADGLMHWQNPGYSSVWSTYSGVKGQDNANDVVRAILAF